MPTPKLYSRYATVLSAARMRYRWRILMGIVAVVAALAVLARVAPSLGSLPGTVLFVVMVSYFAAVIPWVAFINPLPERPWSLGSTAWAWGRAIACSLWIVFCAWAIGFTVSRLFATSA
jgi:hypothetical protein